RTRQNASAATAASATTMPTSNMTSVNDNVLGSPAFVVCAPETWPDRPALPGLFASLDEVLASPFGETSAASSTFAPTCFRSERSSLSLEALTYIHCASYGVWLPVKAGPSSQYR